MPVEILMQLLKCYFTLATTAASFYTYVFFEHQEEAGKGMPQIWVWQTILCWTANATPAPNHGKRLPDLLKYTFEVMENLSLTPLHQYPGYGKCILPAEHIWSCFGTYLAWVLPCSSLTNVSNHGDEFFWTIMCLSFTRLLVQSIFPFAEKKQSNRKNSVAVAVRLMWTSLFVIEVVEAFTSLCWGSAGAIWSYSEEKRKRRRGKRKKGRTERRQAGSQERKEDKWSENLLQCTYAKGMS